MLVREYHPLERHVGSRVLLGALVEKHPPRAVGAKTQGSSWQGQGGGQHSCAPSRWGLDSREAVHKVSGATIDTFHTSCTVPAYR